MNFNSPQFLVFLPLVLLGYALVYERERARDLWLLVASYAFYMAWNPMYAGLIAFSTLVDYFLGLRLAREERPGVRKGLVTLSLVVNLGLLSVFKYYNFFIDVGAGLFSGADLSGWHHELLLPVGISFYTFQTLSYTLDLYRKKIGPERSLTKFALFVSFFPQLVAGPIVRAADFLPQLHSRDDVKKERFDGGLRRVFRGLFKKIVIADLLANLGVDAVFANPEAFSSVDLLFALYGYAFQIYNDFSGYSDIAIGAAAMLGFKLPENFKRPYLSQDVREFWTRWHISLSSWLRDYLYIPLGGNRGVAWKVGRNLLITMLLGGLWHGAALNFIYWGGYHGLLLILARLRPVPAADSPMLAKLRRRFVCFHLVLGGWLLFRVTGMENLTQYLHGLTEFTTGTRLHPGYYAILFLGLATHFLPVDWASRLGARFEVMPTFVRAGVYAGLILAFCGVTLESPSFIYFQF
jgi:alginate O-acetyltransferase complex protein AlgI